jgi:hypothetical protein
VTAEQSKAVLDTKKGDRPDPTTYVAPATQESHAKAFADGGSRLVLKGSLEQYGPFREDGTTFLSPKADTDKVLAEATGPDGKLDLRKLEKGLGLPDGQLGNDPDAIVRIDFPAGGLKIPSGNEAGANPWWIPGGRTPNGNFEAIVDKGGQLRSDANRLAKGLQRDLAKAKRDVEKQVAAFAKPIRQRTQRVARRIEGGVADGVGAVLGRFGVPSRAEVLQLSERVDALSRSIKARSRARAA